MRTALWIAVVPLYLAVGLGVSTSASEVAAKTDTSFEFKVGRDCYSVVLDQTPGETISCTQPAALTYVVRSCEDQSLLEKGNTDAAVSCEGNKRIGLRFRTAKSAVAVNLRVAREAHGKQGAKTAYSVESAGMDSGRGAGLAQANVEDLGAETPEESPLQFKFSGFASIEHERTRRFGYDVGTTSQTAQPNFTSTGASQADQNSTSLLSDLNFELSRDRTKLTTVVEIGEVYYGDTATGGGEGARATNVFELRNFYLTHGFGQGVEANAGIMSHLSDPRGFIYNNFLSVVSAGYKNDRMESLLWYGNANQNRPGATRARNTYLGFLGSTKPMEDVKTTLYWVNQSRANETLDSGAGALVVGSSTYNWAGATIDFDFFKPFTIQATGIYNWSTFREINIGSHNHNAHLMDLKSTYLWAAPQLMFSLEGLATSGSGDSVNSTTNAQMVTKRKNFVSPASAGYLMNIATSEGSDDAPGTPKQNLIANLNQAEGLRLAVFTTSANLTSKFTTYFRFGYLNTDAENGTTRSRELGLEYDLGGFYQITPSTLFQLDLAHFAPGKYYANREAAEMAAAKLKFSF